MYECMFHAFKLYYIEIKIEFFALHCLHIFIISRALSEKSMTY